MLDASAHQWRLTTRFGLGQVTDECLGFFRPTANNFSCTTNLARLLRPTGIPAFLATPRSFQDHPVVICCAPKRVWCPPQAERHQQEEGSSTTTSSRLLSVTVAPNSTRSRSNTIVLTHSATCFSADACDFPLHDHVFAEPQPAHKLHDGGHESQVDGHIGSFEQRRAEEGAIVVGEALETVVARIWRRNWMAPQKMLHLTQNRSAHGQELSHDRSTMGRGLDPCGHSRSGLLLPTWLLGSNSSKSQSGGRAPCKRESHDGGSKPARPARSLVTLASDWKMGQSPESEMPETQGASSRSCATRQPNWPKAQVRDPNHRGRGNVHTSWMAGATLLDGTSKNLQTHRHRPAACNAANWCAQQCNKSTQLECQSSRTGILSNKIEWSAKMRSS